MRTVHEVSQLSGVSVRTLHHYDAIGLLKPTQITEAGYRLYDDAALERLQSILLFRELRFPLREIAQIMDSPDYDAREALAAQIRLLELQQARLAQILRLAREIQTTGVRKMEFSAFDRTKMDAYAAEAKEKWGHTEAYREYEQKQPSADPADLMAQFERFGTLRGLPPDDPLAQAAVAGLQDFISTNYYQCTKEILASLGQMYVVDERFRQNIDARGGDGTAAFVSKAIEVFCK